MRIYYCCLLFLIYCSHTYPQSAKFSEHGRDSNVAIGDRFTPREKMIFEDNFSNDAIHSFPKHWHITDQDSEYLFNEYCRVNEIDGHHTLSVKAAPKYNDLYGISDLIRPRVPSTDYLPDSFTIEFDFLLGSSKACVDLGFYFGSHDPIMPLSIMHSNSDDWVIRFTPDWKKQGYLEKRQTLSRDFQDNAWHHLALSYYKRAMSYFLDDENVLNIQDCLYRPYGITLANSCYDPVSYTNFKIATGKYVRQKENDLKKMPIIYFDKNKTALKHESMEHIRELADRLKKNTSFKLEIDGHADGEGNNLANMKLSQDRAIEVLKQLAAYGIDASRLSAKGFGSSRPVRNNGTEEGRAKNRRVEFKRQPRAGLTR